MVANAQHQEWEVSVPIRVRVSKNKFWSLNLNQYRNAHHHTLDKAKKEFDRIVAPLLGHIPTLSKARLSFILYPGSHQLCDVPNVCAIVDKFFSDTFVKSGKLPDDNYRHLIGSAYGFGEIDPNNPRVDVIIESVA